MAWVAAHKVELEESGIWTLDFISDLQLGSESCCKATIMRHIKTILGRKQGAFCSLGDIEDEDRPSTRVIRAKIAAERSEVVKRDCDKHKLWLDTDVIPFLTPLVKGSRFLGGVSGHHWAQMTGTTSVEYLYKAWGNIAGYEIQYWGQMSTWLWLQFYMQGRHIGTKLVHLQHGVGGGQTLASAINKLERTAQGFPADAYVRAHDCKRVAAKTVEVFPKQMNAEDPGKPELFHRDIVLLNIGAGARGYDITRDQPSYVENAMMRPVGMGWGSLHFNVRRSQTDEDSNRSWRIDINAEI